VISVVTVSCSSSEVKPRLRKDLCGGAVPGADQAQQRVFSADPAVAEVGRRAECLLDGLPAVRPECDVALQHLLPGWRHRFLDRVADVLLRVGLRRQHLVRQAPRFRKQAEQEVFGADEFVLVGPG
jgi:hypothetical protein